MTTILLVRHGEVEGITPPRFRGRENLMLTSRGIRQGELTRDAISARWVLNAVFCSPLSRCVHIADVVARPFHLETVPLQGLNDINYGTWQGMLVSDVEKRWPEEAAHWRTSPHTMRVPGGESLQEVLARAADALQSILHAHRHGTVAVVAHDSVNRILLGHALGLPLSSYWSIAQSPCAISEITYSDGRFTLHSMNETHHLIE